MLEVYPNVKRILTGIRTVMFDLLNSNKTETEEAVKEAKLLTESAHKAIEDYRHDSADYVVAYYPGPAIEARDNAWAKVKHLNEIKKRILQTISVCDSIIKCETFEIRDAIKSNRKYKVIILDDSKKKDLDILMDFYANHRVVVDRAIEKNDAALDLIMRNKK